MYYSFSISSVKSVLVLFSLLTLSLFSFSQVNLDLGLVGYFAFENSTTDSSSVGIDGVGTNLTSVNGIRNHPESAYNFNGATSYIDCSINSRSITNTVSISYWLKTTGSVTTNDFTIEKYDWHVDKGFYMGVKHGYPYIGVRNTSGSGVHTWSANGTNLVNDGTWHHILGAVSGNSIQLWIDGQLEATNKLSATTPDLVNSRPLSFGYYWEGSQDNYFDGDLDEIRLYNRVLTTQEIVYLSSENAITSLRNIEEKLEVSIYPNPVYNELKVRNEQGLNLEISVLDLTGKLLLSKKTEATLSVLDLTNYPSGVYLVQIKSGGKVVTEKVTVR